MRKRVGLCVVGVVALLLPACGGQQMAKVKGRVVYNGQPVKEAMVMFSLTGEPEQKETGKPATAQTDENGNFELSTFSNYDGALVGNHTVHVTLDDTNPAKCKRSKALALEVKPGSNEFTIEMDPPR